MAGCKVPRAMKEQKLEVEKDPRASGRMGGHEVMHHTNHRAEISQEKVQEGLKG